MRAHTLQHVPFEGLGSMEAWLIDAGYQISCTAFFQTDALPSLEEIDLLIFMGGPMSVNDEAAYPWLAAEKAFIRQAIDTGVPTLGVCLGAQLIASALGAAVYPGPQKEIGWFPIEAAPVEEGVFRFPEVVDVFHWHGETFDLPDGAVRLASSAACRNQAFQYGTSTIGLQFHLETTPESARAIVDNCRDELTVSRYVQTEEAILAAGPAHYAAIHQLMAHLLSFLTR